MNAQMTWMFEGLVSPCRRAPSPESSLCTHLAIRPVRTKATASLGFEMLKRQDDLGDPLALGTTANVHM